MNPETLDPLDPVATTARLTAAMRAVESRRPDRLLDDPLAETLAGEQGMAMLEHADAGDIVPVRSRWFDRRIREAATAGVDQIVIVAAGMDTRAWRLDLPATDLYELDRASMLGLKAALLAAVAAPPVRRTPVGVDLTEDWTRALGAAGHDPTRPTCWLAEGLLQYLAAADVHLLLDRITARSAPGSHVLTDAVGAALLEQLAPTPMLVRFARDGMPWVFGTDEPAELLTSRGWAAEVSTFAVEAAAVGRTVPGAGGPDGYLVHGVR